MNVVCVDWDEVSSVLVVGAISARCFGPIQKIFAAAIGCARRNAT